MNEEKIKKIAEHLDSLLGLINHSAEKEHLIASIKTAQDLLQEKELEKRQPKRRIVQVDIGRSTSTFNTNYDPKTGLPMLPPVPSRKKKDAGDEVIYDES